MTTSNTIQQSSTQSSMHHSINFDTRSETDDHVEGDHLELRAQTFGSQTRESSISNINSLYNKSSILTASKSNACFDKTSSVSNEDKDCVVCKTSDVPICHIRRDQLENLKTSTKRLLCLLEEVQEKTHSTALVADDLPKMSSFLKPLPTWESDNLMKQSVADIICSGAMKRLEKQANGLDAIIIKDDADDCSVYKRLARKCHCLNQQEYNDFIIHFNEDTKFCTTTIGEIIKNMRILKKFLYMGGKYTTNSLLFLNQYAVEFNISQHVYSDQKCQCQLVNIPICSLIYLIQGLEEASRAEKSDIIQACAFADICCIFDTYTIVTVCISWPCKNPTYLEPPTQYLAAEFLYNMAKLEEGRRLLNLNSKITCDIKKVLKVKQDKIDYVTIEMLNSILNLLHPPTKRLAEQEVLDEGDVTLKALTAYRRFMTVNELFSHLDTLLTLSSNKKTKSKLTTHLPKMLSLFKNLLFEFDNSDMNVIITNIMNNIVGQSYKKANQRTGTIIVGEMLTSSTGTDAIKQKNAIVQFPVPHKNKQKKAGHPHHVPHSQRPVTVLKLDIAAKPGQASRPKSNLIQELSGLSSAIDEAIKRNEQSSEEASKWNSVQQLNDNAFRQQRCPTGVCRATVQRSQKFFGGENRNVIEVPMEKETLSKCNKGAIFLKLQKDIYNPTNHKKSDT